MSIWNTFLLIGGMLTAAFSVLVIWATIDVRKRFREGDAETAVLADEQAVIGCEGDCNACPLRNLHVGLRQQIRAAETLGTSAMTAMTRVDNRPQADAGIVQAGLASLSLGKSALSARRSTAGTS